MSVLPVQVNDERSRAMSVRRTALAAARKTAGYSQEGLGERVGVERSTIARWEAGETAPQPWHRPKLADALGITRDQLSAVLGQLSEAQLSEATHVATRRPTDYERIESNPDDLQAVASDAARDSLRFADRAAENNINEHTLEHLRWEISRIAVEYVHTPVRLLFRDLVDTRDAIFDLLDKRQRPRHGRELHFLGGTTCLLLAHASQNVGNQRAALAQLRAAWTCADVADHDALRSWSRGTAALINEWSLRQRAAIELTEQGAQFNASRESRLRLVAIEARAAARLGERTRALDALRRLQIIQQAPTDRDDVTDLGGLLSFPEAKQAYYMGSTYGLLNEHGLAEEHAQAAVTSYETGSPAERSYGDETLARLDIVNARIARGDLNGAAEAVAPVLTLPVDQRIRQLDTAIGRTRGVLAQSRSAASRQGRDLLDGLRHFDDETRSNVQGLSSP
ncbi:helix-turn-helix transcriptional regulator [Actinokineospora sp.]|uniref:helix-turn-helix transcriptional regulator n=1 Tax=Actinokineospora sp. TaxID=1872133 RepID=UPI0040383F85